MKKIQGIVLLAFCGVMFCLPAAYALQMDTRAQYQYNDQAAPIADADSGTQGTVASMVGESAGERMVDVQAATSQEGLGAVQSSYLGASDTDDVSSAEASLTWRQTYTSAADSKQYTFYLAIPTFTLGIDDQCGGCGIDETTTPHMKTGYSIEVRLNDIVIWDSAATLEGGEAGHQLSESGTDLGGTEQGTSTSFQYVFGPYSTTLDLGSFAAGQHFTVQVDIRGTSETLNFETKAACQIGDPSNLTQATGVSFGLGAPKISVSPAAVSFDTTNVGETSAPQTITLSSTGQEDLVVDAMTLSDTVNYELDVSSGADACQSPAPTLARGESCTVAVTFTPQSVGTFDAQLDIASNDPANSQVTVSLTGQGWSAYNPWAKLYGRTYDDWANAVIQTADGGFAVAGTTESSKNGRTDAWLLRLNADGSVAWQKTLGASRDERAYALVDAGDGGFVVAGETSSTGAGDLDAWIVKLDADGNKVWEKTYGDDQDQSAHFLARTDVGNLIVGGHDPWIMMLDDEGNPVWSKTFEGVRLCSLQATSEGGAVACLHTYAYGGGALVFAELDSDGTLLWSKLFDASLRAEYGAIAKTASGDYFLAAGLPPGRIWLAGMDSQQQMAWQSAFDAPMYMYRIPLYLQATDDDKSILASDSIALKIDTDGTIIWQHSLVTSNSGPIRQSADGGYIMAGSKRQADRMDLEVLVAKLDASGLIPGCPNSGDTPLTSAAYTAQLSDPPGFAAGALAFAVDDTDGSSVRDSTITPVTACFATPADDDSDGIPDVQEQGPDGNDAAYDGNGDGTPDRDQAQVASFHVSAGHYVTLAAPSGVNLQNVSLENNPAPVGAPPGMNFEYDFFSFTLAPVPAGGAATVTLFLPAGAQPDAYYKYGPTPADVEDHWYEFDFDGQTGAEINGNVITLHFVDGQRGDDDLAADGVITEPGGPAFDASADDDNDGGGGGGGGNSCFISSMESTTIRKAAPALPGLLLAVFGLGIMVRRRLPPQK